MNALEQHIEEINRLYKELKEMTSRNERDRQKKKIKNLEDDLLEWCSWQGIPSKKVFSRIVK